MKYVGAASLLSIAASALLISMPAAAQTKSPQVCAPATEQQIASLFDRWNDSLRTGDPDKVLANYAPDGVLLPTVSNQARTNPAAIKDYFVKFLKNKPQGTIDDRFIRIGCNVAQDVGNYTFKYANGKTVHARYTYVYEWKDDKWLIAHHHSSAMPEPVAAR